MIDQAMTLIAGQLNAHLGAQFSTPDDIVAISPLTDMEDTSTNRLTAGSSGAIRSASRAI